MDLGKKNNIFSFMNYFSFFLFEVIKSFYMIYYSIILKLNFYDSYNIIILRLFQYGINFYI